MTPALRLLWALRDRGIRVEAAGTRLRVLAAPGAFTEEDRVALLTHKAPLLQLLGTPCPCAACTEKGDEPHGPRCYCPACLDADPKWEAWRQEIAEQDRFEAEERAAIQEEGCA